MTTSREAQRESDKWWDAVRRFLATGQKCVYCGQTTTQCATAFVDGGFPCGQ